MELPTHVRQSNQSHSARVIGISTLIGVVAGLFCVLYRLMLTEAEELCFALYAWVGNNRLYMPVLFVALALTGYLIGRLVEQYPLISGSGIPQVKATIMGHIRGTWLSTLLAKLVGGTVAVLSGLSLGREGPSIQLGACVGQGISRRFATSKTERRIYIASGASAGLAAAFNAPLSGVMFALEEIFKYFSPMILLSTMVAAISADFISKVFFGITNVFSFEITQSIPIAYYWLFLILGCILGCSGVVYNLCLVKAQKVYKSMKNIPLRIRMIIPFVCAGVLGLTFPVVLCGGHSIIEELNVTTSITFLVVALVVKFFFSMVSFGSGAPGGIFFPLLVLGATIGAIFAKIVIPMTALDETLFYNFVIIAMAGYFTAIVRAPLTGIVLLVEMTGSLSQLLPLILVSAVAYVVAEELGNKPVYESLLESLLESRGIHSDPVDKTKILVETIVQYGSVMEGKAVRELDLPSCSLIVSIKRGDYDFTPNGSIVIQAGDYLTVLTSVSNELAVRDSLAGLTSERKG
ncbi:ClC family H(+)/Cl(-) exchange transporter [Bengtsoniella intestinalis]|uniref:ClC family H(+)/Cl(-) exchange transporter n=1 Tax=Bengtsoniella intestinalis TaxID=3073143 RepID=UPI00391F0757